MEWHHAKMYLNKWHRPKPLIQRLSFPQPLGRPDGNLRENPRGQPWKFTVYCCFSFSVTKLQQSVRDGWKKQLVASVRQPSSLSVLCTQRWARMAEIRSLHPPTKLKRKSKPFHFTSLQPPHRVCVGRSSATRCGGKRPTDVFTNTERYFMFP